MHQDLPINPNNYNLDILTLSQEKQREIDRLNLSCQCMNDRDLDAFTQSIKEQGDTRFIPGELYKVSKRYFDLIKQYFKCQDDMAYDFMALYLGAVKTDEEMKYLFLFSGITFDFNVHVLPWLIQAS